MRRQPPRGGIILVLVLVALGIAVAALGLALRSTVAAHRQLRQRTDVVQADWLARSALDRAAARRAADADYAGEGWDVTPADLPNVPQATDFAARVTIEIAPTGRANQLRATAVVTIPPTGPPTIRRTHHIHLDPTLLGESP